MTSKKLTQIDIIEKILMYANNLSSKNLVEVINILYNGLDKYEKENFIKLNETELIEKFA